MVSAVIDGNRQRLHVNEKSAPWEVRLRPRRPLSQLDPMIKVHESLLWNDERPILWMA